ncbi:nuclear transport factor 2 family protein [soil metagenome]
MSLDPEALVKRYLDTVVNGTAEDVAALYADDATLEDPVGGGEVHIGRTAIAGFYGATANAQVETELLQLRVGGHEAAFVFAITVTMGETKVRIEPIEVMNFNGSGEITSMKAYWGPADINQI